MKKIIALLILPLLVGSVFSAPKVILKLDDFTVKGGRCSCKPVLEYLLEKQIKAGFGVIAKDVDTTARKVLSPYLKATNAKGEPLFEIWHHGWDHIKPEFLGTGYEYQKKHFDQADQLIRRNIGVQMHTFGTPYNASDSVTNQVFSENPEYKVFLLSSQVPVNKKGILYLNQRVNIENGTGNPQYKYFREEYDKYKDKYPDYMILQGHPNMWTPEKLEEFKKVIDFLQKEGCSFVLPYEYDRLTTKK